MNKFYFTITFLFFALVLILSGISQSQAQNGITFPLSLNYASTYWWRGIELNGRSVGVMWLGAGAEIGKTGLTINFYSALSQDYLIQFDESQPVYEDNKKIQKAKSEFDYGISYESSFAKILTIDASLYYVHYPFYDDDASISSDPSFVETSLSFAIKTILNPKITVFYDYYVEETDADTPVDKDYYINLALSHPIVDADSFTFTLGAWVGYYNNAYLDASGFSDAGISAGFGYSKENATYNGTLYYARSLTKDFQIEYEHVGILKNHLWAEFEIIYKL